jgi:hypothetical protein
MVEDGLRLVEELDKLEEKGGNPKIMIRYQSWLLHGLGVTYWLQPKLLLEPAFT